MTRKSLDHWLENWQMRSIRTVLVVLLAAVVAGFIADRYLLPTKVNYYPVTPHIMALEITGPGLLDAINKVVITARIQGFLLSVGADKNDHVKQGQVLAQLESADLRNQLVAAQAEAQAAKSAISEAGSERDRASAMLRKAQQDYQRRAALAAVNVTSKADLNNAEAALKDAQANFARTSTAIERATAQSAAANANVNVLQARLADATIRSPIDGIVVSRERNVGDLLTPGAMLMQIIDPASIVVSARFDESNMDALHPGDPATVRFASNPTRGLEGKVLRLTRQVDQETREFTADITLRNLPDAWAIGQRAKVSVETQSPARVIAVPKNYISREDGRAGVWLEREKRAIWMPVSLGQLSGTNIEVTHGLEAGDVVLDPHGRYFYQPVALNEAIK